MECPEQLEPALVKQIDAAVAKAIAGKVKSLEHAITWLLFGRKPVNDEAVWGAHERAVWSAAVTRYHIAWMKKQEPKAESMTPEQVWDAIEAAAPDGYEWWLVPKLSISWLAARLHMSERRVQHYIKLQGWHFAGRVGSDKEPRRVETAVCVACRRALHYRWFRDRTCSKCRDSSGWVRKEA